MSRQFDAKQEALAAHPEDREAGVSLFRGYLGVSEADFSYEEGKSAEEYIYGAPSPKQVGGTAISQSSRPQGFYWCRHRGIETVLHYDGLEWWASGDSEPVPEHQLSEIDERPIERQEAMPVFRTGGAD